MSTAMEKVDLKKELRQFYTASAKDIVEVEVPTFRYLMIDGAGDPNTSADYAAAVEALFSVSYAIKFAVKKGALAIDYGVMPLEGLWWADDPSVFASGSKADWQWTMMIMQPSLVLGDMIASALADVAKKKQLRALDLLRLEDFTEGRCAQLMHIGPFSEEGPTVARLLQFIADRAAPVGKHHEIYLSDIRRADPRKWKTIIRHPMA